MNERDREKKLRALFNEAHRAERPPAFGQTWEAARRMRSARIPRWALIPALAAAALLIVLAVRKQSGPPDAPKEFQTAEWSGEVDARLGFATPGIGVLDGLGASSGVHLAALDPSVLPGLGATIQLRFATLGESGPLDFLLQTPGSELLHTVPTFDTDRSWP
ncbi:MAG TPA: hypothetical protein VKE49_08520 [Myxococcaceae bacterium]|nr:hypothetical protein [Myxococcaceae bacterium]